MKKIRVDREHHRFLDSDGKPFIPMGVSYYRPGTGWAPQLWKQFDAEATRRDFALLKEAGANVVRVFGTTASFWSAPDKLNPEGMAKFDKMLDLADEAGLYLHPTGPSGWEGCPPWITQRYGSADAMDGNRDYLAALGDYWKMFAARYKGRNTLWAYDLENEPCIQWDTPRLRELWDAWRKQHGREPSPFPATDANAPGPVMLDFQHFRESLAVEWTSIQAKAIREADPDALVTIGLVQWSVPSTPIRLDQYTAFRPEKIAPYLDFMELHFYPWTGGGYLYKNKEHEVSNLSVVESMSRECAMPGLPLVIAEFGWFGGGPFYHDDGTFGSEEDQAGWCRHLVEVTSSIACGWINWGMYDTPDAKDVSTFTGLFTIDGKEKAWGRTFRELAQGFAAAPPSFAPLRDRPNMPWDKCIVSTQAMDDFRQNYLEAFSKARGGSGAK